MQAHQSPARFVSLVQHAGLDRYIINGEQIIKVLCPGILDLRRALDIESELA